jgi:hypothetical protein
VLLCESLLAACVTLAPHDNVTVGATRAGGFWRGTPLPIARSLDIVVDDCREH